MMGLYFLAWDSTQATAKKRPAVGPNCRLPGIQPTSGCAILTQLHWCDHRCQRGTRDIWVMVSFPTMSCGFWAIHWPNSPIVNEKLPGLMGSIYESGEQSLVAVKPGNWFGHVLCVHQILSMYVQSPVFGECSSRAASASLKKSGDGFWDMKYLLNPIETQKSKVQSFWSTSPPEGILHRSAQFAFPFSMKTPNRNGSKHAKSGFLSGVDIHICPPTLFL